MIKFKKFFFIFMVLCIAICGCKKDDNERKLSHFEKGKAYFEKKEYKSAEIELRNALQIDTKYYDALLKLGETYLKLGNAKGAVAAYTKIAELNPDNTDAQFKLATFHFLAGIQNNSEDKSKIFASAKERVNLVLEKKPDDIDALLLYAAILEQEKNVSEAASVFQKILGLDKKQTQAYMGLARVSLVQENFDDAENFLKQAVETDSTQIKTQLNLFNFYLRRKEFDKAEAELSDLVQKNPKNAQLSIILADFYLNQKKETKAETVLSDAIKDNPKNPDLHLAMGNFYLTRQNKDKAEASFLKAIEADPKNIKAYMVIAAYYDVTGSSEKALSKYNEALKIDPENIRIMNAIARFYMKNKKPDEVENYLAKIFEKNHNYFPARMLKGEILVLKKDYDKAVGWFDGLIKDDPNSARAYYFKGVAHFGKNEIQEARENLEKAVNLKKDYIKAELLLADIYLRERNFDKAQEHGEKVLSFFEKQGTSQDKDDEDTIAGLPEFYQVNLILGNIYLYKKQPEKAKRAFESLIKADPKNPSGYYRLGLLYRQQKNNDAALENFEKALALNSRLMDVFTNIVLVHAAKKELGLALQKCDAQLDVVKDTPKAVAMIHGLKGRIYLAQQKKAEAEASFKAVIQAEPNDMQAYYALAQIYLSDKREDEAIAQLKTLLEQKPNEAGPHMLLGTIYEMQKQLALAEQYYRKAVEINKDFVAAKNNLAYILAEQNKDLNVALGFAQDAKGKLPDDPAIMDTLGWVYYKKGFYDNAIAEFKSSLEKLPENAVIHYHLGLAYHKKGETDNARESLKKALSLDEKFDGADQAKQILSEMDKQ